MRKLFCILILALTSTLAYAQRPDQIELPCPAGSSPTWMGQSYDQATGKYRQWQCVQQDGTVTQAITDSGNGGQVYNVKAYGAKGDCSTDDAPSFQSALNAAEAVNGNVLIPAVATSSCYKLNERLTITSGVTIEGMKGDAAPGGAFISFGSTAAGGACSPGTNGFIQVQAYNVTIENLQIDGSTSIPTCLINVSNSNNSEISGFRLFNVGLNGGSVNNLVATGNTDSWDMAYNIFSSAPQMIYSIGTSTAFISGNIGPGNTFTQCTNPSDYMIHMGTGGLIEDVSVFGNRFEGSATCNNGIENVSFVGHNWFGDAGTVGTWVNGATIIVGNTIYGSQYPVLAEYSTLIGNRINGGIVLAVYAAQMENNQLNTGAYVNIQSGTVVSNNDSINGSPAFRCYVAPCSVQLQGENSYLSALPSNVSVLSADGTKPATITSASPSGTATWSWSMPNPQDKQTVIYFNAYENTSATAQTFTVPLAYALTPIQGSGCPTGLTISGTTVTLPSSMGATFTGQCIIEGQ